MAAEKRPDPTRRHGHLGLRAGGQFAIRSAWMLGAGRVVAVDFVRRRQDSRMQALFAMKSTQIGRTTQCCLDTTQLVFT
jgi:hypothetical protein